MMRGDGSGPMIADGMSFGAALIRRPVFGRVGPVDETLRNGGDIDWFLRARECGVAIGVCEGVTLLYRRHGRSVSADAAAGPRIAEVVARSLRRRRTRPAGRSLAAWRAPAQEPD
jgi:GT2 family glycosyltransferase